MANKKQDYEGDKALAEVLFDSIGDGAVTTDEFGNVTRINPTAQSILGYSEKEALGKWFPKLCTAFDESGETIPLIDRPVTRAFVTGNIISEKIHYKTKAGNLIPVSMTISPIMVNGQPVGCIEIFRDISREYEIDKMKSDFISLASHQLRTPLSAIKTYSHMLADGFMGPLSPRQNKSLKTIIAATNRMNETIGTLLNITRIESGSIIVTKKPVAINQIIEEVISEHQLSVTEKKQSIKLNKSKDDLKIISDSVVLKEIIGNLVSNAVKYTPSNGKITIDVSTRDKTLVVAVRDTGMGIPEAYKDNIFTKFFRGENVIRQETSGTGLGLYLVKGLVNELGGNVWFESTEGKGSTFYLSLPLLPQAIRTNKSVS